MADTKSLEISGIVIDIFEGKSGEKNGKQWRTKSFMIETEGQYPDKVAFYCFNDVCDKIPVIGTKVEVGFNPKTREYNGKLYTSLQAWKIFTKNKAQGQANTQKAEDFGFEPYTPTVSNGTKPIDDDLPF